MNDDDLKKVQNDGGNLLHEWGDFDSLTLEEKNLIVTLVAGCGDGLIDAAFSGQGKRLSSLIQEALTAAYLLGKGKITKEQI